VIVIPAPAFAGQTVAVLGLGRSGQATARALAAGGARVVAWDDDRARREEAEAAGITPADLLRCDWRRVSTLVMSPGIPLRFPKPHPVAAAARAAGCAVICDIEILLRAIRSEAPGPRVVGITGTNGKSTTTALTTHVLRAGGHAAAAGGNIGVAALALDPLGANGVYVLELSSYQLELIETPALDAAVLLNVTPDHLDRHGGFAGYVAAKQRVASLLRPGAALIVGSDDAPSRRIAESARREGRRVVPIAIGGDAAGGIAVRNGRLVDDLDGRARTVADLAAAPALPGAHNWQNAGAAYGVARMLGMPAETAAAALLTYPGLAHRQECVATINGVRYINDSKATNADATAKALACYDRIHWIAGGRAKEGGIASLAPWFARIACAYLVGESADAFAATIAGRLPYHHCGDLAAALQAAHRAAQADPAPGAVVLLSPAAASFDQWRDFEARGDAFREMVQGLDRLDSPGGPPRRACA